MSFERMILLGVLVCVEVLEVALVPKPVLEALRPCEVGLSSKPVAITVTTISSL